jgi:D-tyrosyl-tRNA(Tyr) deacylase
MKLLIQRVTQASVVVDGSEISKIAQGLLVFIGIAEQDDESQIDWLVNKLIKLRIFEDDQGKMNLSLSDLNYEIMLISQFTLYANSKRGLRPDFTEAAKPDQAQRLYNIFIERLKVKYKAPKTGVFGADMKVSLLNDGPVTIILEK